MLDFYHLAIWNVVCYLRMCMLDNKLQTFSIWFLFQQLCGRKNCGTGLCFSPRAACERVGNCVLDE